MAERTPCLRRCSTIRAPSPNHEGVEGTDRDVVWMLTDPSAILFMCASLMEVVLFFLIKEAHFYLCSLQVTSRCASRGPLEAMLTNMKDALRVNGVLLILDLYEESLAGTFTTLAALPAAVGTSNGFRPACVRCACSLPLKGNRFRILRKHLRGSQEERDRGPLLLPHCCM